PSVPTGTQVMDKSAPAGNLDHGSVDISVGGATLKITGADLGGDLFRSHIEYSGPAPGVSVERSTGHIEISQSGGFHIFGQQRFTMDLKLSSSMPWTIAVHSGAANDTYDSTNVHRDHGHQTELAEALVQRRHPRGVTQSSGFAQGIPKAARRQLRHRLQLGVQQHGCL